MTDAFRLNLADRLHRNAKVDRPAIFGADDPRPVNLPQDAETMFAGAVGPRYRPGGLVFLAINPGGGGDTYTRRTPEDERFYPLLQAFKSRENAADGMSEFEAINRAFAESLRRWNLWRILSPCLDAAGMDLDEIAYLNAVPYRTRGDAEPRMAAKRAAWQTLTGPTIDQLAPRFVVALGKKAGGVLTRFYKGPAVPFVVSRTIGDSYVSDAARAEIDRLAKAAARAR
ncbi:hypothetical protein BAL199_13718 [alpha proteobacterium BAL199]|jgi:hypothetical protein|nr:hypothetical protein BAL199_13718 [alpha proteobacterium BAL199]